MFTKTEELKDRIEARRHDLMAKMAELKADSRKGAAAAGKKIQHQLDELEETLKDGWDNVTDAVRDTLNRWLDKN